LLSFTAFINLHYENKLYFDGCVVLGDIFIIIIIIIIITTTTTTTTTTQTDETNCHIFYDRPFSKIFMHPNFEHFILAKSEH